MTEKKKTQEKDVQERTDKEEGGLLKASLVERCAGERICQRDGEVRK